MDLYKEVLFNLLKEQDINVSFEGIKFDYNKLLEDKSYMAMNRIKEILADDTIDNESCLKKIEEIVATYHTFVYKKTYDFNSYK